MSLAVINIQGFVKHIEITEDIVRYGRLRVAVPRLLADMAFGNPPDRAEMKCIEFYIRTYDKENHIAYFDNGMWV